MQHHIWGLLMPLTLVILLALSGCGGESQEAQETPVTIESETPTLSVVPTPSATPEEQGERTVESLYRASFSDPTELVEEYFSALARQDCDALVSLRLPFQAEVRFVAAGSSWGEEELRAAGEGLDSQAYLALLVSIDQSYDQLYYRYLNESGCENFLGTEYQVTLEEPVYEAVNETLEALYFPEDPMVESCELVAQVTYPELNPEAPEGSQDFITFSLVKDEAGDWHLISLWVDYQRPDASSTEEVEGGFHLVQVDYQEGEQPESQAQTGTIYFDGETCSIWLRYPDRELTITASYEQEGETFYILDGEGAESVAHYEEAEGTLTLWLAEGYGDSGSFLFQIEN